MCIRDSPNVIVDQRQHQIEYHKQAGSLWLTEERGLLFYYRMICLFELKHKEVADLYRKVCFRPAPDQVYSSRSYEYFEEADYVNLCTRTVMEPRCCRRDDVAPWRMFQLG